jgi:hypothetical protein
MKKIILFASVLLSYLISCTTVSHKQSLPSAQLNQYGIFLPEVKPGVPTNTIFKDINITEKPKLINQTTHIPCNLGTRFGVLFDLDGLQEDSITKFLTISWSFPRMVSPDGRVATSTMFQWPIGKKKEDWHDLYFDWGLEEKFELVPGNWTIIIYYEDLLLLQQTFIIEGC